MGLDLGAVPKEEDKIVRPNTSRKEGNAGPAEE